MTQGNLLATQSGLEGGHSEPEDTIAHEEEVP